MIDVIEGAGLIFMALLDSLFAPQLAFPEASIFRGLSTIFRISLMTSICLPISVAWFFFSRYGNPNYLVPRESWGNMVSCVLPVLYFVGKYTTKSVLRNRDEAIFRDKSLTVVEYFCMVVHSFLAFFFALQEKGKESDAGDPSVVFRHVKVSCPTGTRIMVHSMFFSNSMEEAVLSYREPPRIPQPKMKKPFVGTTRHGSMSPLVAR